MFPCTHAPNHWNPFVLVVQAYQALPPVTSKMLPFTYFASFKFVKVFVCGICEIDARRVCAAAIEDHIQFSEVGDSAFYECDTGCSIGDA